ncbi:MAG: 2-oxoacid:acceptor oxidoreductase family protein [Candidatus Korarchaeum sp.]|nr:2-oxoacid:acceptor oxidoreductase family protein [Candidatus Korarchaeum sp.]MDW8035813.1 2-oxoacid:acceptor oxidoreductase family protein [Candidatus Korarchaeum sp.]
MEDVVEVRWHGRGGQGAVLASRIAAGAAFLEGKWSQAFPFFGAERRGAPVTAFTRIGSSPIRLRSQIYEPDVLVLMDPMFLKMESAWRGVKPSTVVVANAPHDISELPLPARVSKLAFVDATAISIELGLRVAGLPIPNSAMVGALVKGAELFSLESAEKAIRNILKRAADINVKALRKAYEDTKVVDEPKFLREAPAHG